MNKHALVFIVLGMLYRVGPNYVSHFDLVLVQSRETVFTNAKVD